MEVFETSAKNGMNLDKVFQKLIDLILKSRTEEELIKEFGVKSQNLNLGKRTNTKKDNKMCCK